MATSQIKLVLLGDTAVGKTSIVQRFVYGNYNEENPPTIGASFTSKVMEIPNTSETMKLQIWDTAGQEKYKSLASMYYKDATAALLVYDITSQESFENIKFWVKELKDNVGDQLVVAIAANKSDLIEEEMVDMESASQFANEVGAVFKQTSAKENIGIFDIFLSICLTIRPDLADIAHQTSTASTSNSNKRSNSQSVKEI